MIIVTGGAGFIGSNIVYGLNKLGITDILIVDNLSKPDKHINCNCLRFSDYMDKRAFIEGVESFKGKQIEAVFHQGACSDTMETDGLYMIDNNYEYSKRVFDFCTAKGAKFIYASSASVYGNGKNGFVENRECEYPLNLYAFSKFLFDNYMSRVMSSVPIQVVGLRYFNVFGPQEKHKGRMASVVFHFHKQIREEQKIKLFRGSRDFVRDFVFVDDIVDVNLHFYNNNVSGIFNCGTGEANSFYSIAEIMKKKYPETEITEIDFPEKLKGKYQTYTKADLSKLRSAGGYTQTFADLETGVLRYLDLLEKNGGYLCGE